MSQIGYVFALSSIRLFEYDLLLSLSWSNNLAFLGFVRFIRTALLRPPTAPSWVYQTTHHGQVPFSMPQMRKPWPCTSACTMGCPPQRMSTRRRAPRCRRSRGVPWSSDCRLMPRTKSLVSNSISLVVTRLFIQTGWCSPLDSLTIPASCMVN